MAQIKNAVISKNKIDQINEQWKPLLQPTKRAKANVYQSIGRFLEKMEKDYPMVYEHFLKRLHYNGTETSYTYTSDIKWELD